MALQNWSATAASNATQPGINWAEGMPPSDVNNSARQMMADVATWYSGPEWLTQADTPAYVSATSFTVPGNKTAVYSVGRRVQAVGTGYTIQGTISSSAYTSLTTIVVTWDTGALDNTVSAVGVGILQNQLTVILPAGTILPFGGSVAPSGFLACDGSAVSRTTYARLFSAIGTAWGAGDGSTTFNVPSLSRKTLVGSGGTGTATLANTVGSTGGEETHALTTAELAVHTHGTTENPHTHGTIENPHTHNWGHNNQTGAGAGGGNYGGTSGGYAEATSSATTGLSINSATTGITINNAGSGNAHNNIQPSAVVLMCIKY